jgi:hypothetical protein
LQNAIGGHLEFLRFQQGVDQVREEKKRGDAADDVVHSGNFLLEMVAGFRKEPADNKKREGDDNVEDIEQHSYLRVLAPT